MPFVSLENERKWVKEVTHFHVLVTLTVMVKKTACSYVVPSYLLQYFTCLVSLIRVSPHFYSLRCLKATRIELNNVGTSQQRGVERYYTRFSIDFVVTYFVL